MLIETQEPVLDFATYANTTVRVRIDDHGRVGIGTTAPANNLDVAGAAAIGAAAGSLAPPSGLLVGGAVQALAGKPINAQTGTTYTLAATDAGSVVTLSNASAITLTVPLNATTAQAIGCTVELVQLGAGKITVAGASGVTVNAVGGFLDFAGQYARATLMKYATDTWVLSGGLASS